MTKWYEDIKNIDVAEPFKEHPGQPAYSASVIFVKVAKNLCQAIDNLAVSVDNHREQSAHNTDAIGMAVRMS